MKEMECPNTFIDQMVRVKSGSDMLSQNIQCLRYANFKREIQTSDIYNIFFFLLHPSQETFNKIKIIGNLIIF